MIRSRGGVEADIIEATTEIMAALFKAGIVFAPARLQLSKRPGQFRSVLLKNPHLLLNSKVGMTVVVQHVTFIRGKDC